MTTPHPAADSITPSPAPAADSPALRRLREFGRAPRIVALDIARGLAVLGMAAAHTVALPGEILWNDSSTWVEIVSGRSSILFAVLAGVSIAIMTGRTRVPRGAELGPLRLRLIGRGLVIFAIGLVLELLGTNIAVILTFYGAVYAVAILFIGVRIRTLLIWAAGLAVVGPALVAAIIALSGSADGSGIGFLLNGTYSIVPWTALMLAGLALGRLDLTRRRTAALTLLVGIVLSAVGYTAGALWGDAAYEDESGPFLSSSSSSSSDDVPYPSVIPGDEADLSGMLCEDYGDGYLSCYPEEEYVEFPSEESLGDDEWLPEEGGNGWESYPQSIAESDMGGTVFAAFISSGPHSGGSMEILGSGGFALAVIGLLLLTGQALRYVLLPIAAIGSMPLTAYTAHVIAIWIVIGPSGWTQPALLYPFLAAGLLVACTAWAIFVGRGPLERLTARISARLSPAQR